ncbi:hypothetical protein [Mycobacterium xenopi]|uniref:Uncharacterized protein n=1 Tax=Mycobacterium xenopi TaxID=1789 RepID=A0AAD1GVS2_MYCXE|nr:hypothetical protein [Mycobacterium xenopi]MDA3638711.1 hypothetical protein [Mycobacterium xenopi]BBU20218.1 hypothetical protein MYXE_00070 [Mycobacterium xenopi]SPX94315.1 Uncharacterised protein [Mycobacterium xenopi]
MCCPRRASTVTVLLVVIGVVVAVVRFRRGVEVWHVAAEYDEGP